MGCLNERQLDGERCPPAFAGALGAERAALQFGE